MSGIGVRIILFFIGLVFLIGLVSFSFSSGEKGVNELPYFGGKVVGTYLHKEGGSGSFEKLEITSDEIGGTGAQIFERNTDLFTSIYSTRLDYNLEQTESLIDITISTGSYLFDFRNPIKKAIIRAGEYNVSLEDGGMVYIEKSLSGSFIASLNSVAELDFIKTKGEAKKIQTYLYPHMYLGFKTKRLEEAQDLDSLRLSQLASLGYFSETFDQIESSVISGFIKNTKFLFSVFNIVQEKQVLQTSILEKNQFLLVGNIPGLSYIEQYFLLFYNDKKKIVYYQNKVLENSVELLKSRKVDRGLAHNIENDLLRVKEMSISVYEEMLVLIQNFSHLAFNDLSNNADTLRENHYYLMQRLYGLPHKKLLPFTKDFDKRNYVGSNNFYTNLLKNYTVNGQGKNSNLQYDYYLFFIKNVILGGFNDKNLNNNDFGLLVDLFNEYSDSLNQIDFSTETKDDEHVRIITHILYNEEILQAIKSSLLFRYFGERNYQGLLEKNKEVLENVDSLEEGVNNVELFYTKGKKHLLLHYSKYKNLLNTYISLEVEFREYFLALQNYALYQKKYSDLGKAIGEITVVSEDNEDEVSQKAFVEYMSGFRGIDTSSIVMNIVRGGYNVENLLIGGRSFSFFLDPYRGNRLMNIHLKNSEFDEGSKEYIFYYKLKNITYELDDEEEKYEDLFKKAKNEEKERLDFKNFFVNNFFPADTVLRDICKNEFCDSSGSGLEDEDEVIQLFKSAKLLGSKGEFRNIRQVLDLKYANILVKKKVNENFDITIVNTDLSLRVQNDDRMVRAFSEFDSQYMLEGESHYFYNIVLKPFERSLEGGRLYTFNSARLHIQGNIHILNFKDEMAKILEKIPYIHGQYKKHISENRGNITQINYYLGSGEVTFE